MTRRAPLVRTKKLAFAFLLGAAVCTGALLVPIASAAEKAPASGKAPAASNAPDRVILKSGRVVDGTILEETESTIVMNVVVSGITAKTTYNKSEILEVKRGANAAAPAADSASKPADAVASNVKGPASESKPAATESATSEDPSQVVLYVMELDGRFGFDISKTSLINAFKEADRELKDTIPGSGETADMQIVDPAKRDKNIIVLKMKTATRPGFGSIFTTENIAPVVEEQIVLKGRRVVFWVEEAIGGAAVMPFISPDIYFTPEGRLGGIADLDQHKTGDHMVDEKLIGAFMGHAEGFIIKGGYAEHIPALRAMLRKHLWLAVRFEGGKPVYINREPGDEDKGIWDILSDDGEGENKDEEALRGNDLFILEPDWAEKLGISDGTVSTIDDLAFRLGVQRNYKALEENKGQKALDDWKQGIEDALNAVRPEEGPGVRIGTLWRDFADAGRTGQNSDDPRASTRARGKQLSILRQIRSIVTTYGEVLDPDGSYRAQLDTRIAELQLQGEIESRSQRQRGGR